MFSLPLILAQWSSDKTMALAAVFGKNLYDPYGAG